MRGWHSCSELHSHGGAPPPSHYSQTGCKTYPHMFTLQNLFLKQENVKPAWQSLQGNVSLQSLH